MPLHTLYLPKSVRDASTASQGEGACQECYRREDAFPSWRAAEVIGLKLRLYAMHMQLPRMQIKSTASFMLRRQSTDGGSLRKKHKVQIHLTTKKLPVCFLVDHRLGRPLPSSLTFETETHGALRRRVPRAWHWNVGTVALTRARPETEHDRLTIQWSIESIRDWQVRFRLFM